MTNTRLIDANKLSKAFQHQQATVKETMLKYPDQENYYRGRLDSLKTALLIVTDMQEDYGARA